MRNSPLIAVLTVVAISGCSSSVHPILTDAELTHDIDLNGTWKQIADEDTIRIPDFKCESFDQLSGYDVTLIATEKHEKLRPGQKQIPREYEMRIGRLDGVHYLQISRSKQISGGPAFFEGVVTYTWTKFTFKDDILHVYPVDDHALETLLPKTDMTHLMHKPSDLARNIVITESTGQLQAFFSKHHRDLFATKPLKFKRSKQDGN